MVMRKKLEYAKEAIISLIVSLSPEDKLHLVVYDDTVQVIFQNETRTNPSLIDQVKNIRQGGSTNLWAGVEKGAEVIRDSFVQGQTKNIFLFSDGLVNCGVQNKSTLFSMVSDRIRAELKIKLSSFGLGADFDEELMNGLSEIGGGVYFFIESSEAIPRFISHSLCGLLKSVGTEAVLSICGCNGGILKKIYGHENLLKGAFLGDLREENTRTVVCELEVKPDPQREEEEVVAYELTFKKPSGSPDVDGDPQVIQGKVKVKYTTDASLLSDEHIDDNNRRTEIAAVVMKTAVLDKEIVALIDRHEVKEAIRLQEEQIQLLKTVEGKDATYFAGSHRIKQELNKAQESLTRLQSNDYESSRKEIHHRAYRKQRNSACYNDLYD